ncbi:putative F-box domain-containing protein [Seiridium cardinale]|uniref:F-box domain-containing protein n=1 Tax=Seiridium cardinale TaxID=138064 RepID=A0ABR2Y4D9_9PEZI
MSSPRPSSQTAPSKLAQLPVELVAVVSLHLSNHDIKQLRLTCKCQRAKALLHLDRDFLSANLRNIDVFRAIAGHDTFRKGIRETVWDDARLIGPHLGELHRSWEGLTEKGCSLWGFHIITRELANAIVRQDFNDVLELVLDVNQRMIGLDCRFLHQPSEDYDNLVAVLKQPNFRRIDLALLAATGTDYMLSGGLDWHSRIPSERPTVTLLCDEFYM